MNPTSLFLESPLQLVIFSFCLLSAALLVRPRLSDSSTRRTLLLAPPAAFALLFVIQRLVVTEREQILARLADLIAAVEHQDVRAFEQVIHTEYDSEQMNKDALMDNVRRWLEQVQVRGARVRGSDITFAGGEATLELGAVATVSLRGGPGEMHVGRWALRWRRDSDEWRITAIKPKEIDNVPIESLRRLDGFVP